MGRASDSMKIGEREKEKMGSEEEGMGNSEKVKGV